MADKTIGQLPSIPDLYDDSLIPVEQQGVASKMTGKQFADFARESVVVEVQRAADAADKANAAVGKAKSEADRAEELRQSIEIDYDALHEAVQAAEDSAGSAAQSAKDADGSAKLAESYAVGGTGTRSGENTDNAKYYSEQSKKSADVASDSVQVIKENADGIQVVKDNLDAILSSPDNAKSAAESAQSASESADRSESAAELSESWAVGGTGTRQGEDENNAKYWADRAQAEAERASVPPVTGVYNVILSDRVTGEKYVLLVEDGRLVLLGVSDELDATHLLLIDRESGISYAAIVEDGRLKIEEVG